MKDNSNKIRLIINADDYGLNEHCSKAIAQAFSEGLITDTTMMATGEFFDGAIRLAAEQGFADNLGIHLNLTEGEPLTEAIKKLPAFVSNGRFNKQYNRVKKLSKAEQEAIYRELTAQVEKLQAAGVKLTHADSHHHIHTAVFIAPIAARVCREHGIDKMRLHRNIGDIAGIKMLVKKQYNRWLRRQGFTTTDFFGSLHDIENAPVPDNCEIMVHPDFDKNGVLVDRTGMTNGVPEGNKLPDLRQERNVMLRGYVVL